jgi:hypothetical protein
MSVTSVGVHNQHSASLPDDVSKVGSVLKSFNTRVDCKAEVPCQLEHMQHNAFSHEPAKYRHAANLYTSSRRSLKVGRCIFIQIVHALAADVSSRQMHAHA